MQWNLQSGWLLCHQNCRFLWGGIFKKDLSFLNSWFWVQALLSARCVSPQAPRASPQPSPLLPPGTPRSPSHPNLLSPSIPPSLATPCLDPRLPNPPVSGRMSVIYHPTEGRGISSLIYLSPPSFFIAVWLNWHLTRFYHLKAEHPVALNLPLTLEITFRNKK